jgi:hypothetical protein
VTAAHQYVAPRLIDAPSEDAQLIDVAGDKPGLIWVCSKPNFAIRSDEIPLDPASDDVLLKLQEGDWEGLVFPSHGLGFASSGMMR